MNDDDLKQHVAKPIELATDDNFCVAVMEDISGISLRDFALHKKSLSKKSSDTVSNLVAIDSLADKSPVRSRAGSMKPQDLDLISRTSLRSNSAEMSMAPPDSPRSLVPPSREEALEHGRKIFLEDVLTLAYQISEALYVTHSANVIHNDVNPDNIAVHVSGNGPILAQLIDFNLSELNQPEGKQQLQLSLHGTLAYLSPEQTGRIDRHVDYRTDFYSLGMTLWEIAVGQHPFRCSQPSEYIHAHLAKEVDPARNYDVNIPEVFSRIIAKLVSKDPEDRYQSAYGLARDLNRCVSHLNQAKLSKGLSETEKMSDEELGSLFAGFTFSIAEHDFSNSLELSSKLFGRDLELSFLQKALQRVANGGRGEWIVIGGDIGEGKTSLINELQKYVEDLNGFFGEIFRMVFDPFETPEEALHKGFYHCFRRILSGTDESLEYWRHRTERIDSEELAFVAKLYPDINILTGLSEEIEPSLNDYDAVNATSERAMDPQGTWKDACMTIAVEVLVRIFASRNHPLVIVVEDIHKTPAPVLEQWIYRVTSEERPGELFVTSYQRSVLNPELKALTDDLPDISNRFHHIKLGPLDDHSLQELLRSTLFPSSGDYRQLSSLILRKTMGNPMHVREFLRFAHRKGYLYFCERSSSWIWDIRRIDLQLLPTEGVTDLIIARFQEFPKETRLAIQLAASDSRSTSYRSQQLGRSIGSSQVSVNSIAPSLNRRNLRSGTWEGKFNSLSTYKFFHERAYTAVYATMSDLDRRSQHHQVAQILRQSLSSEEELEDYAFELASQFNKVDSKYLSEEEKVFAARMNCLVGVIASQRDLVASKIGYYMSTAYQLIRSVDNEVAWTQYFDTTFLCKFSWAQTCLLEDTAFCEDLLQEIRPRCRTFDEKVKVTDLQMRAAQMKGNFEKLINIALTELNMTYNFHISEELDGNHSNVYFEKLRQIAKEPAEEFVKLCQNAEKQHSYFYLLLNSVMEALYLTKRHDVFSHIGVKSFCFANDNLILDRGLGVAGCLLSALLFTCVSNFPLAKWLSEVVLLKLETIVSTEKRTMGYLMSGLFPLLDIVHRNELGSKLFAEAHRRRDGYLALSCVAFLHMTLFKSGRRPSSWKELDRKVRTFLKSSGLSYLSGWNNMLTTAESLVSGIDIHLAEIGEFSKFEFGQLHIYRSWFLILTAKSQTEQLNCAEAIYGPHESLQYLLPRFENVALDIVLDSVMWKAGKRNDFDALGARAKALEAYSEHCATDSRWLYDFAKAELESLKDNDLDAVFCYESAISILAKTSNLFFEAIVTEHLAQFWLERNARHQAKVLIIHAFHLWLNWGSEPIARALISRYRQVLPTEYQLSSVSKRSSYWADPDSLPKDSVQNADLDLTTVLKVAQSLTNETQLDAMLSKILRYVIVNAGARRGILLLQERGKLVIQASGEIDDTGNVVDVVQTTRAEAGGVPVSVVYYCYRTKEPVLLHDASNDPTYSKDPYISTRCPGSILCCPIVHQNVVSGVVYLENDLNSSAFSQNRTDFIRSLMTAASVSIENAKLLRTNTELANALKESAGNAGGPRYNIDAPIKKTIDILHQLKLQLGVNEVAGKQIDFIMQTLASNDLFISNIDEINDENGRAIDVDTLDWIQNSLLQRESRKNDGGQEDMFFLHRPGEENSLSTQPSSVEGEIRPDVHLEGVSPLDMVEINKVLEQAMTFDFDVFQLNDVTRGSPLLFLGTYFLQNMHATDVLQTMTLLLLADSKMASNFTKLEIFAACVASAVHDVDHPHPLAVLYNDIAVLEYHHASKAFQIASESECNIFEGMTVEQFKDARKFIISMVVATDMSQHFTYINKLKSKIAASALKLEEPADRALVLEMAIKCADLNNPTKSINACKRWAFRVMEEFFKQGDKEKRMGIPVTNIAKNRGYWESVMSDPATLPTFPEPLTEEIDLIQFTGPSQYLFSSFLHTIGTKRTTISPTSQSPPALPDIYIGRKSMVDGENARMRSMSPGSHSRPHKQHSTPLLAVPAINERNVWISGRIEPELLEEDSSTVESPRRFSLTQRSSSAARARGSTMSDLLATSTTAVAQLLSTRKRSISGLPGTYTTVTSPPSAVPSPPIFRYPKTPLLLANQPEAMYPLCKESLSATPKRCLLQAKRSKAMYYCLLGKPFRFVDRTPPIPSASEFNHDFQYPLPLQVSPARPVHQNRLWQLHRPWPIPQSPAAASSPKTVWTSSSMKGSFTYDGLSVVIELGRYLDDPFSKGAFDSVYTALSQETAETVTIKQIQLQGVPPLEVEQIMELKHHNVQHLATNYICQDLDGLVYLHDQGVITGTSREWYVASILFPNDTSLTIMH
ncbi:hypothetical protein BJ742DRAFT_866466 [Cladochytrium replicatum]|nr:hypothetical protein BJ742DRAFT_866466 [Cladochytrium replicatum]